MACLGVPLNTVDNDDSSNIESDASCNEYDDQCNDFDRF